MKKLFWILILGMCASNSFADTFDDAMVSYDAGDYVKSAKLFKKSCDGGDMYGCTVLGNSYRDGEGVKQDKSKAKKWYGVACDGGEQLGCDYYRELN
jgi:TPR repeat protein